MKKKLNIQQIIRALVIIILGVHISKVSLANPAIVLPIIVGAEIGVVLGTHPPTQRFITKIREAVEDKYTRWNERRNIRSIFSKLKNLNLEEAQYVCSFIFSNPQYLLSVELGIDKDYLPNEEWNEHTIEAMGCLSLFEDSSSQNLVTLLNYSTNEAVIKQALKEIRGIGSIDEGVKTGYLTAIFRS